MLSAILRRSTLRVFEVSASRPTMASRSSCGSLANKEDLNAAFLASRRCSFARLRRRLFFDGVGAVWSCSER